MERTGPTGKSARSKASTGRRATAPPTEPSARVASASRVSTMPGALDLTNDFTEESPFNTSSGGTGNLGPERESSGLFRSAGNEASTSEIQEISESFDTRIYATPSDASRVDNRITLEHIPGETGEATRILRGMDEAMGDQDEGTATPSAEALRRERRKAQSWPDGLDNQPAGAENKPAEPEVNPVALENKPAPPESKPTAKSSKSAPANKPATNATAGPSGDKGKMKAIQIEFEEETDSEGNFTETRATPRKSAIKHSSSGDKTKSAPKQDPPKWSDRTMDDYKFITDLYTDIDRMNELKAYELSHMVEMVGNLAGMNKGSDKKDVPKKVEIVEEPKKEKRKARVSLGVNIDDLEGEKKKGVSNTPMKKKDKTQGLPSGGYLAEKLRDKETKGAGSSAPGDPDDSSSSSSSSSSSDDSSGSDTDYENMTPEEKSAYKKGKKEKERRKRKKQLKMDKLKLSGYKTKLPTPYNGESNYDIYEQFVYEVETWVQDTGFSDREAVRHVKGFLKDKAAIFYMNHVAPNPKGYTMKELWKDIFEYCFPPDVKARQRKRFYQISQSDRGFKDFVRDLRKYQKRVSDISEEQVAQRVWDGALPYLRVEWAKAGMNAEDNTVEELEESGVRFEVAERIRRSEENRRKEKDRGNFKPDFKKDWKPKSENYGSDQHRKDNRPKPGPSSTHTKRDFKPKGPKLTKEQMDEYRAKGKCFLCAETGHITKDCPKRNSARPTLSSSAVNFAQIDRIYDASRGVELNNINFNSTTSDSDADCESEGEEIGLELNAIKKRKVNEITEIERNSATPKDIERRIVSALVVEVFVNGHPARALMDSGSVGDFISSTLVDQLKLEKSVLAKPVNLSMAVAGSKGVIKYGAKARIGYCKVSGTSGEEIEKEIGRLRD